MLQGRDDILIYEKQQQAPVQLSAQHLMVWLILIKQGTNNQPMILKTEYIKKMLRSCKPVPTTLSQVVFLSFKIYYFKIIFLEKVSFLFA